MIGILDFHCGGKKRIAHTGDFGMSVKKEYRGRGIGTALLEALLKWTQLETRSLMKKGVE